MRPVLSILLFAGWLAATMVLWFFAFMNMPETVPGWLQQAQAVCFGRSPSGLPEDYGWLVLVGSPLSFLVALMVVYWNEIIRSMAGLYRSPFGKVLILVCVLAVSAETAWVSQRIEAGLIIDAVDFESQNISGLPEYYPQTQKEAHDFRLLDQHGEITGPSDFKGRPVVLTFAFSHCTTVCPALLNDLKEASRLLNDETPMLIVSLDPWRDRSTELESFAGRWEMGRSTRFYTGDVQAVLDVLEHYQVPISRNEQNGDISHPPMVYVLDAEGRIAFSFNSPGPIWLADAVRRLQEEDT
jgi:protein SCO1/2